MTANSADIIRTDTGLEVDISPRKPRLVGMWTIFLVFGVFGTWSAVAPLQSAALASGTVEVRDNRKTVQHLEGGIIDVMLVREGDYVNEGQPIIKLDETQDRAQLGITMGQYLAAKAEEARLLAEQAGEPAIGFPDELVASDDTRAKGAMRSQENVFATREKSRTGQEKVLEQKIEQLRSRITGISSLKAGKMELIGSYNQEIADYQKLLERGFSDKVRLREMQREVAKLMSEVADNEASIAEAEIEIGETELEILQLDRSFQAQVADELGDVQTTLFDLEERRRALTDKLERTTILAPVAGVILDMSVTTIGGVVRPGEPILDVVPETDELIVNAQLAPADIDRVRKGQFADIRFTSFNTRTTPVIEGELIGLSADILTDQYTGTPYYSARVEVTEKGMGMLGDLELVPGMPAEVLIKTGSRTLFQYLTAPVTDAFARSMIEE